MERAYGPPSKERTQILSKLPTWATVGIDIPNEELLEYLRIQTSEKTPEELCIFVFLFPVIYLLLLALLVLVLYHVHRRDQKKKQQQSEIEELHEQIQQGQALKEVALRLEEVALRLESLEKAKRAMQTRGRKGRHRHQNHRRTYHGSTLASTSLLEDISLLDLSKRHTKDIEK